MAADLGFWRFADVPGLPMPSPSRLACRLEVQPLAGVWSVASGVCHMPGARWGDRQSPGGGRCNYRRAGGTR